ncbi:MAG: hypothetical protein IJP03_04770 [Christensenellaceae bacterium]|nr:hypothetical protein [Christensenellaceae bacterium]
MADELLRKRLLELARRAYDKGIYTYTDFLSMAEIAEFRAVERQIAHVPRALQGGAEGCERQMVCFGSEELCGYSELPPICCLEARPLNQKFADKLTHRDFLGSLMGLGIKRQAVGDIVVRENMAYIFCLANMADYICQNLVQVRRTGISCHVADSLPTGPLFTLKEVSVQVSSERLDAVIAHVWHLSRGDAAGLFAQEKVFVNGAQCISSSHKPAEGDVVSVRGLGRFAYGGVAGVSRKGKLNVRIQLYEG